MFLLSHDYWEIKKTKDRGRGVFAKKDIPPGRVIGDYIGMVIPIADDKKYDRGDDMFLMYFDKRASIYPDPKQAGVHIMNHSCTPNCWFYEYYGHTLSFSLRTIFAGEELTIDYLLDPIDASCKPCKHVCKCEEKMCRGTWHMPQRRAEEWWTFIEKEQTKYPKLSYETGKVLPALPDYPKLINDDEIYTLFGAQHKKPAIYEDATLPSLQMIRKSIRTTGKTLLFKKLNIHVQGILNDLIIIKKEK